MDIIPEIVARMMSYMGEGKESTKTIEMVEIEKDVWAKKET